MPLTPQDVSNKRFTPVKGRREGYDMGEVDQFLDEVEAEIGRLLQENQDLRDGNPVGTSAPVASTDGAGQKASGSSAVPTGAADGVASSSGSAVDGAAPTPPAETLTVTTAAQASAAATRLLELATRNADELVGEATQQAEQIVGSARSEAERLAVDSRQQAERLESEARNRAQLLESETNERRAQLFGDLETEKRRLAGEVDDLRSFEREYRARLKTYFSQQLAALDGQGGIDGQGDTLDGQAPGAQQPDKPPSRLQSLLGHGDDGRDA